MEIYCQDTHITVVDIISHFEGWTPDCFCFFFVSYRGGGSHEQKKNENNNNQAKLLFNPVGSLHSTSIEPLLYKKRDFGRVARGLIRADDVSVYNTQLPFYILYPPPPHPCASNFWYVFQGAQPALKKRKKKKKKKMWRWPRRLKYIVYASLLPLLIFTVLSCAGCVV